jgi:hypothetical protein
MTAPDEAVVMIQGSYRTSGSDIARLEFLQCAKVTMSRGYRYFILTSGSDTTTHQQIFVPGSVTTQTYATATENATAYANTAYGNAQGWSNSESDYMPPRTVTVTRFGYAANIKMANDAAALLPFAATLPNGNLAKPKDAVLICQTMK